MGTEAPPTENEIPIMNPISDWWAPFKMCFFYLLHSQVEVDNRECIATSQGAPAPENRRYVNV